MEYQADNVETVTKESYNVVISFEVDGEGNVRDGETTITYQDFRDGLKKSVEPEKVDVDTIEYGNDLV